MANPQVSYSALNENDANPFAMTGDAENPRRPLATEGINEADVFRETDNEDYEPHNSGVMIHVVPEASRGARWNHIDNLDSFFTRMYNYHQRHGFSVMMLQEMFGLLQFPFVIFLLIGLLHCVNYDILFNGVPIPNPNQNHTRTTIPDVIIPPSQCLPTLGLFTWLTIFLSALVWVFRLIKFLYHFIQYWDIKLFFNTALKIADADLDNLTWHEVQKRVREVQSEQQMCIHKEQLTELDIYHRILRFKNYMVAMMNKSLIPSTMTFPFVGEVAILSRGLRYNIELILFWGPFSPFENNWNLKEEYKRNNKRIELARKLSTQITWLAIINLFFSPFLFLWQLMYFFFNYADIIKREPGALGLRCWSQYGKLYLRHFNELDHELDARLNRAYRPSVKYMNSFSSPLITVIARQIIFFFGGIGGILLLLSCYNEQVLHVEHVFTILAVCTALVMVARAQIPDENLIWCPEQLLLNILAHVHYLPSSWCGKAHTSEVRNNFEHFFQLKAMFIINELLSPLITPFVLLSHLRPKALDIVDFFRSFTVTVVGVGDVCSFAQMDVRKHGNVDWQITKSAGDDGSESMPPLDTNQYTQGEHGKTELSLVHFTLTNPDWKMPSDARHFVQGIKRHAYQDLNKNRGQLTNTTAMGQSLIAMDCLGGDYSSIVSSLLNTHNLTTSHMGMSMFGNHQAPTGTTSHHSWSVHPIVSPQQQLPQNYMTSPQSFDFMLQQNLTDNSMAPPLRSGYLHNITEDEDQSEHENDETINRQGSLDQRAVSSMSIRGGLRRREGPLSGSQNGILYSLYGNNTENVVVSPEFTVADMCLSTLYLHELHQRHVKRRGIRLDQSQRHLWQRPHQESSMPTRQSTTPIIQHPFGTSMSATARQERQAERTPLLTQKKS